MRYRLLICTCLLLALCVASPARADITSRFSLTWIDPVNTEAGEAGRGNFGLSGELEFHLEGIPDAISWAAGLDYADMLSERSYFLDADYHPWVHELNQDYFRFWFGPRLRSHADRLVRPYLGAQVALIYYSYRSTLYLPGDEPTPVEKDSVFRWGYGFHGGLEFRFSPTWSLDLGVKYMMTFGEPRQLSFDSVTVHPSYLLYQLGVRMPLI